VSLIGVRDLREQASEVIRKVREEGAEYVITYQGRPVALLLPLDAEQAEKGMVEASKRAVLGNWERYEALADELRRTSRADVSTQDLMDAIRR
jgi:prevent-host-death family protein